MSELAKKVFEQLSAEDVKDALAEHPKVVQRLAVNQQGDLPSDLKPELLALIQRVRVLISEGSNPPNFFLSYETN